MKETSLEERVEEIRARITAACDRAGRDPGSVRLVAVSKTFGPDRVAEVASCGIRVFGENRIQEAREKIPACPGHLQWHLVGHLQSNKIKVAVPLFDVIHSVDSIKLLRQIDACASEHGKQVPVLLQVNVSGEASKHGLSPEDVPALLDTARDFRNAEICGLMTIPPATPDAGQAAPYFRQLRDLRDQWQKTSGVTLSELSMGMSHDFEVAIAEGATWIRIGTALFGDRNTA